MHSHCGFDIYLEKASILLDTITCTFLCIWMQQVFGVVSRDLVISDFLNFIFNNNLYKYWQLDLSGCFSRFNLYFMLAREKELINGDWSPNKLLMTNNSLISHSITSTGRSGRNDSYRVCNSYASLWSGNPTC